MAVTFVLLKMLHRLTPTERMQLLRCFHELFYRRGIGMRVLPQRPADGLVDEEFIRAKVFADEFTKKIEIGFTLVAKLE